MFALTINNSSCFTSRGRLKSPWSRRKRKHALTPPQWRSLFTPDGKLRDRGVKFLKKVRSGVSVLPFFGLCVRFHFLVHLPITQWHAWKYWKFIFLILYVGCWSKYQVGGLAVPPWSVSMSNMHLNDYFYVYLLWMLELWLLQREIHTLSCQYQPRFSSRFGWDNVYFVCACKTTKDKIDFSLFFLT